ncbi:MAG TPA: beta-propeller fold lactonase family protein [Acidobacteriaceae bacterium]|jgi:6-phosphogluconolactonase (cycloisomerase 2 family)|nr:beta-propeller fold lactonase family protein [Acidobacteriaceae bacterium]
MAAASMVGLTLLGISCGASNTIDFVYVTSNLQNPGQINVFEVNSQSGALRQIADSPYPSGGRNPVDEVASPNGKNLYVVNHDDNTIVEFAIGTDGKLYPLQTVNTPGTEPVAVAINSAGTALYVLDYYAPSAPGQPSYTDLNPGPGAIVVYPISLNSSSGLGTIGSPQPIGASNYLPVQCFPTSLTVTPNGNFVYVTNTNAVVVTTSPPVTGTVPTRPASCPASGTVSAFAVTSTSATEVPGSPFTTGTGSQPTGIVADPDNASIYVTDSALNLLYTYSVQSSGALALAGNTATGNLPMGGTVVSPVSSSKFLYISNYTDGSLSIYNLISGLPVLITTSNAGSSGPLCVAADPNADRFLYSSDYIGGTIGGAELDPSTGTLITNQNSPYATSGQPTCVAAITHAGGNKHGL